MGGIFMTYTGTSVTLTLSEERSYGIGTPTNRINMNDFYGFMGYCARKKVEAPINWERYL